MPRILRKEIRIKNSNFLVFKDNFKKVIFSGAPCKFLKDILICKTKIFRMVSFAGRSKYGMRINRPIQQRTKF